VSDPDVNELEALSALLESDGWALFTKAVNDAHGDTASVLQIDAALKTVDRGDALAVQDTVQQIRARARAVQAMMAWPMERVKALRKKEKPGMFAAMRRA
jgi:hypothetical protein